MCYLKRAVLYQTLKYRKNYAFVIHLICFPIHNLDNLINRSESYI